MNNSDYKMRTAKYIKNMAFFSSSGSLGAFLGERKKHQKKEHLVWALWATTPELAAGVMGRLLLSAAVNVMLNLAALKIKALHSTALSNVVPR